MLPLFSLGAPAEESATATTPPRASLNTRALLVSALPPGTSPAVLAQLFGVHGALESVVIHGGLAQVVFERVDDAAAALLALDASLALGGPLPLRVQPAESSSPSVAFGTIPTVVPAASAPAPSPGLMLAPPSHAMDAAPTSLAMPVEPPVLHSNTTPQRMPRHGGTASIVPSSDKGGVPLPPDHVPILTPDTERVLLGANAGVGISLGDDCIVEAGLYLTAGTRVTVLGDDERVVKASELSGANNILFRRNSVTGAVEALARSAKGIELNPDLH